ncbi:hypothetical protein PJ602_002431, partial [Klebsiella pneumoniae]
NKKYNKIIKILKHKIISAFIVHFSFNIYRYFRQNNTSSYRVMLIIKKIVKSPAFIDLDQLQRPLKAQYINSQQI